MTPRVSLWHRENEQHDREGATAVPVLLPISWCPECGQDVNCTGSVEVDVPSISVEQTATPVTAAWPQRIEMSHYVPYRGAGWVRHAWGVDMIRIPRRKALHVSVVLRATPEHLTRIIG